jgi:hypothetical protein
VLPYAAGMRRCVALLALAVAVATPVAPQAAAEGGAGGSYRVRVLPDPTVDASPYGACGVIDGSVLATDIGRSTRVIRVPAGRTLAVKLVPDAQVFAGDEGMLWRLRLVVANREVARSGGPAWRTEVSYRVPVTRDVRVLACNRSGFPDATISYTIR